jgi:hypothetical protein
MPTRTRDDLAQIVRDMALPLTGIPQDYDPLMELIGEARYVLIGEASHGTHEFYRGRAAITRSMPSRMRASSGMQRSTTARCSCARCRRGTCATGTCTRRSLRW